MSLCEVVVSDLLRIQLLIVLRDMDFTSKSQQGKDLAVSFG